MYYLMAKELLTVRDVDEDLLRRFRAKSEGEGLRTGQDVRVHLDYWTR